MVTSPMKSRARGALIVFEGVDRCGKSTQSQLLVEKLTASGVAAELWRFPDRTSPTGKMVDSYLRSQSELDDAAVHLLFSANRWEKRKLMLDKLQTGTTLIVDRYAFSGAVFTAAKQLPGLDLDWCKASDRGLPAPDAILFLDLSVEAAAKRGGYGGERYEREAMQHEVRRQYGILSKTVPGWITVNADQEVEPLCQQFVSLATEVVQRCTEGRSEILTLWEGKKCGEVSPPT